MSKLALVNSYIGGGNATYEYDVVGRGLDIDMIFVDKDGDGKASIGDHILFPGYKPLPSGEYHTDIVQLDTGLSIEKYMAEKGIEFYNEHFLEIIV